MLAPSDDYRGLALRTTRASYMFGAPFRVAALDATLAAGTYDVVSEEEIIEGNDRTAYVRVATLLRVRTGNLVQTVTIDPALLQDAVRVPD